MHTFEFDILKFLSYFILELPNKERSENEPLSVLLTYFADTAGEV